MTYEWDQNKNIINIHKHGISFEKATTIFNGRIVYKLDVRNNYGEDRFIITGKAFDKTILTLICTLRNDDIRIISARVANKREKVKYEESK